jgi:glycosyltransferase involved in cell wall biosynthesis
VTQRPATTEPLRILHVGKFYPPVHGGMEVFLADLIAAQRARGIEARRSSTAGRSAAIRVAGARAGPGAADLCADRAGFPRRAGTGDRAIRPDALHLHMPNNAVFWALTLPAARKLPWIVHWHADVAATRLRTALRARLRLYRPFEQAVLERAERIIVTSPPYLGASEPLRRGATSAPSFPSACKSARTAARYAAGYQQRQAPSPAAPAVDRSARLLQGLRHADPRRGADSRRRAADRRRRRDARRTRSAGPQPDAGRRGAFGAPARQRRRRDQGAPAARVRRGLPCLVRAHRGLRPGAARSDEAWPALHRRRPARLRHALAGGRSRSRPARPGAGRRRLAAGDRTRLRDDPALRHRLGDAGRAALVERFSIDACAQRIAAQYALCFAPSGTRARRRRN